VEKWKKRPSKLKEFRGIESDWMDMSDSLGKEKKGGRGAGADPKARSKCGAPISFQKGRRPLAGMSKKKVRGMQHKSV